MAKRTRAPRSGPKIRKGAARALPFFPPEILSLQRSTVEQRRLRMYEWWYSQTPNPIFVWLTLHQALTSRAELPVFVLQYLRDAAGQMSHLTAAIPKKDGLARAVYRALGFHKVARGGNVNPFRTLAVAIHNHGIFWEVAKRVRDGHKVDMALDDVAREHPAKCEYRDHSTTLPPCSTMSRSTVARIWRQYKNSPTGRGESSRSN
jgi:hypothetical protein